MSLWSEVDGKKRRAENMRPYIAVFAALPLLFGASLLWACGGGDAEPDADAAIDPANFQATVDSTFFPLSTLGPTVFEGLETDPDPGKVIELRVESTVLAETDTVAGVEVTVVEVKDYEDGELAELTLDYYAQLSDGTVYYLGERVDNYEDGELVDHEGQWLAGEGDNLPGVFMPAGDPQVGEEFDQERAPGVAEDQSKVVAVDQEVTTSARTFTGCVKTEDFDPIGGVTEFKYYCPDVGMVMEEDENGQTMIELTSY
jgi:hypothetical protein